MLFQNSFVLLKPILQNAVKNGYAKGAFNVNTDAQAKAVIKIHETFRSAALLQGADLANAFMGGRMDFMNGTLEDKKKGAKNIAEAVKKYGGNSSFPVALHLDHGKKFDAVKAAIDAGYTSVMIDGSHLPSEDNVALTREVVKYAHERGVSVEGELGVLVSHGSSTVPQYIVKEINALGGNIKNAWGIPLDELKEIIPYGVGKINIDTDIRLAVTRNIREFFVNNKEMRSSKSIGEVWKLMEEKNDQFDPRAWCSFFPSVPTITKLFHKPIMKTCSTLLPHF